MRQELTRVVTAVPRITREVEADDDVRPLLVSGPPSAVLELSALLTQDGDPALVRRVGILDLDDPQLEGSPAIVYVVRGALTPTDERALSRADRRSIPIVCLLLGDGEPRERILPYVRATDVVRAPELDADAVDAVARRIGVRARDDAPALARRLPALRAGVASAVRRRGPLAAAALAAFSDRTPGSDLPALALAEIRTGLRLGAVEGRDPRQLQAVATAAALAAGLGLRAVSRGLTGRLPLPAFLVRAAVAYAGARALAEAASVLARKGPEGTDGAR